MPTGGYIKPIPLMARSHSIYTGILGETKFETKNLQQYIQALPT